MTGLFNIVSGWFKTSLRLQILTVIGLVISVLMILISIGILLQWRALIIEQHIDSAKSFSRAFSIPVIEVLVNAEHENGDVLLETHIQSFMDNVDGINYISVQDRSGVIIAHSDLSLYGQNVTVPASLVHTPSGEVITAIYDDDEYGWMLEAYHPLQIGQRQWGSVLIGFSASHLREKISGSFYLMILLTVIAIIITLSLLYYFINKIMSSLRNLVVEVDKFDLVSGTGLELESRSDEIGFLIDHFEMLKQRLNDSKIELENAQRQIYQAEKLASIGRLASGVAHEVNNPLNGMRFCVYAIRNDPSNKEQTLEYLDLINEGLGQIESVVTKLLGYSRQRTQTTETVEIGSHIKVVLDLLEYRIRKKHVTVEVNDEPGLPAIQADPNLVREMLMNLILNSLDAVGDNGRITIETSSSDGFVTIKIRDNGTGIKKDELERIFDPFYSTKETGKGTGLGLSVTLGIVESHQGRITVDSEVNKFTEFVVKLPMERKHENTNC